MKKFFAICMMLFAVFATSFLGACGGKEGQLQPFTKVVIMSGQSNMVGFSRVDRLTEQNIGAQRLTKLSQPIENVKILTENMQEFQPVRLGVGAYYDISFGPEIGLAEVLSQKYPNEDVYIIKFAVGGTSLFQDWKSPSMVDEGENVSYCYHLLTQFIKAGLEKIESLNPKIVGFCWMQGEADAENFDAAWDYCDNLSKFVGDLRRLLDEKSVGGKMNFVDAKIGNHWQHQDIVNRQKERFAATSKHNHLLDTLLPNLVKEGVDGLIANEEPSATIFPIDPLHYDATSMLKLGNMFGQQIFNAQ